MNNFTKSFEIREVNAPIAAADDTDDNSDRIDMSGYESVTFICAITDCLDTGVATMTAQQNIIDSDSGMASLTGTATATSAANDDLNDTLLVLEVVKPRERYVQCVLTSATANVAFGNTIAILSRARTLPVSEHASVQDMNCIFSPAES